MARLTIRNLDEDLKAKLHVEAALHGNSMEEEVRCILRNTLMRSPAPKGLGKAALRSDSAQWEALNWRCRYGTSAPCAGLLK